MTPRSRTPPTAIDAVLSPAVEDQEPAGSEPPTWSPLLSQVAEREAADWERYHARIDAAARSFATR
jgi:hypothetical protein